MSETMKQRVKVLKIINGKSETRKNDTLCRKGKKLNWQNLNLIATKLQYVTQIMPSIDFSTMNC